MRFKAFMEELPMVLFMLAVVAFPVGYFVSVVLAGPPPSDCQSACEKSGQIMLETGRNGCKCAPKPASTKESHP